MSLCKRAIMDVVKQLKEDACTPYQALMTLQSLKEINPDKFREEYDKVAPEDRDLIVQAICGLIEL